MLSLMDPVELEDLVVFRDDEDPRKFYLLPDQPVIPLDDERQPEFLFIKYQDVGETAEQDVMGGWVQFRSVLSIAPERRQRVIDALRTRLEQEKAAARKPFGHAIDSTEPLLAAPLWTDGKVALSTFQAGEGKLVRQVTGSVAADLAGDLGASFGLELDPHGAEIFWSAFNQQDDKRLPILVSYQLTYKARVSAKLSIEAHRDVIHEEIWKVARPYRLLANRYVPVAFEGVFSRVALMSLRPTFAFPIVPMLARPAVREVIHKTITDNKIQVRIETDQAGGGEDEEKVRELMFKIATEVLSDQLIPALFGDATPRPGAASEGDAQANKELLELKEEEGGDAEANFSLTLDHQSTVDRTVNPNGAVQLLLGDAMDSCFRELRLSDGFFDAMKVTASTAGVNFERDGIDSIHVFFRYEQQDEAHPDRPWVRRSQDGMLRSEKDALYWRFDTARNASGGHKRGYEYRMEVFYREGPPSSTSWTPREDRMLTITPRAMGALRVEAVLTAPQQQVESARVVLRYQAMDGGRFENAMELTPQANKGSWFQFTGDLGTDDLHPPEYSYQVHYRVGGGEVVLPWTKSTDQTLEIASPFKKVISFVLRPQGSFDGVSNVSGDIVYEDSAHEYKVQKSFLLDKLTASFNFDVPVLDGGPEVARWRARVNRADGSALDLKPGEGPPGTVWLGTEIDFLTVQVIPDLLDFEHDVQLVVVQLSYGNGGAATPVQQTFTFSKATHPSQTWRVGRRPESAGRYDANIRYIAYDRAKSSEVHLQQIEDQVLVLDRAAQA
jgi:hypothetical protein